MVRHDAGGRHAGVVWGCWNGFSIALCAPVCDLSSPFNNSGRVDSKKREQAETVEIGQESHPTSKTIRHVGRGDNRGVSRDYEESGIDAKGYVSLHERDGFYFCAHQTAPYHDRVLVWCIISIPADSNFPCGHRMGRCERCRCVIY